MVYRENSAERQIERYWKEKHKDKEFTELRDEWYAKLKDEGFEDLEYVNQKTKQPYLNMLAGPSVGDLHRSPQRKWNIQFSREYYSLARVHYWEMLEEVEARYQRKPKLVRARLEAWQLHAEGMSFAQVKTKISEKYEVPKSHVSTWLIEERAKILPKRDIADDGSEE